jgi:hypothetical protein
MAGRSDELRRNGAECARLAAEARDPDVQREFRALARRFVELAARIEEKAEGRNPTKDA